MTGFYIGIAGLFLSSQAHAFQPDPAMLRRVFEEALARRQREYGASDPRTAQAARDLGLFLQANGNAAAARRALADAFHIDEKALGATAGQTLEDAAALAAVSPPAAAEPLLRRAAESADPTISGPALSGLAGIHKAAGDRAGAAAFYQRAVEKAEAADGKNSPIVALLLNGLALTSEPKDAIAALERALAIDRGALGSRHPQTLQDARLLAGFLRRAGRAGEAAELERLFNAGAPR